MKHLLLILFLHTFCLINAQTDSLLTTLDEVLKNDGYYTQQKESQIDSLKQSLPYFMAKGKEWERYQLLQNIATEYATYKFDSAFLYSQKAIQLAYKIHNTNAIAFTKSEFGHLLVSVGLHKEAIDTLSSVQVNQLTPTQLQNHYSYLVRAYYDLADFINDQFYAPQYRNIAASYVDSVLKYQDAESLKPTLTKALRFLARWQPDSAYTYYNAALHNKHVSLHQKAMAYACLGYIDIRENRTESGKDHLIRSVIADKKTATKEAISLIVLANYFYEHNQVERAYKYILLAKKDAQFFGSKQRLLQVSEVFPKIEGAQLLASEKSKEKTIRILWVITAITIAVILLLLIVFKQLFNLQKIWKTIDHQNKELTQLNNELKEANVIKEKYIAHFFNTSSIFINKLDALSKSLNTILVNNNTKNLKAILRTITPKKERDQLFHNFDEIFLSIFPSFIEDVNQVLQPELQYQLKPDQLLNTELRILALMRLGMEDNETMSQVLGVSINTIYTYKTKAQNRSILPTDQFFIHLQQIKSA